MNNMQEISHRRMLFANAEDAQAKVDRLKERVDGGPVEQHSISVVPDNQSSLGCYVYWAEWVDCRE